jgi:hypothetical protein
MPTNDIHSHRCRSEQISRAVLSLVVPRRSICSPTTFPTNPAAAALGCSAIGTVDGPTTYDRAWPPLRQERCIPACRRCAGPSRSELGQGVGKLELIKDPVLRQMRQINAQSSSDLPRADSCSTRWHGHRDDLVEAQQLGQLCGISSVRLHRSGPYRCPAPGRQPISIKLASGCPFQPSQPQIVRR